MMNGPNEGIAAVEDGVLIGFLTEACFLQAAGLLLRSDGKNGTKSEWEIY